MRFLSRILIAVAALSAAAAAGAPVIREEPDLGKAFAEAGVTGTFVLYDVRDGAVVVFDRQRAEKRFIPASTFKIPNTLIGLETRAVKSVDEVLPYGGNPQPFKQWERDMPLREAITASNVPVFQELARRVGLARMREWIARLKYGNETIGDVVDRFWLDGPLEISALEQTQFLARLAQGQLPCQPAHIEAVNEITLLETGPDYALHGKTGWGVAVTPAIGWWVGWVERDRRLYAFALNIDMIDGSFAARRAHLGRACLAALGVLPESPPAP
jgi:beta-lactamase class D